MELDELVDSIVEVKGLEAMESILDALREVDAWYASISRRSRWMDLIGDYAGNERFVIDGDALLKIILDDPLMAIGNREEPSFQIVHAKWALEKLLKNILDRFAVFDIVFWEENRHAILHMGCDRYMTSSRYLARKLLYRHLCRLEIPVHVFQSVHHDDWVKYVHLKRPMFIMTSGGGQFDYNHSQELLPERIYLQRFFLHDLLVSGLAVAYIDGIEFRDAKIMAFVQEDLRRLGPRGAFPDNLRHIRDHIVGTLQETEDQLLLSVSSRTLTCKTTHVSSSCIDDCLHGVFLKVMETTDPYSEKHTLTLLKPFIAHMLIIQHLELSQRAQRLPRLLSEHRDLVFDFLSSAFLSLVDFVNDEAWNGDIDIRLYICLLHVQMLYPSMPFAEIVGDHIDESVEAIVGSYNIQVLSRHLSELVLVSKTSNYVQQHLDTQGEPSYVVPTVLPFHNEVLDKELAVVHVRVEGATSNDSISTGYFDYGGYISFKDDRHWHRERKLLPKHLGGEDPRPTNEYARKKALNRHQRFMAHLQRHAITLEGALGANLKQKTIVSDTSPVPKKVYFAHSNDSKKQGKASKLTKKELLLKEIQSKKQSDEDKQTLVWWKQQLVELHGIADLSMCISKASALSTNKRTRSGWLSAEYRLFCLHLELQRWIMDDAREQPGSRDRYSVNILRSVKELYDYGCLSPAIVKHLKNVLTALGFGEYLPSVSPSSPLLEDRPLNFEFTKLIKSRGSILYPFMQITEHPVIWQLRLFGEWMDRSMNSQPDHRVDFKPDEWQRNVLDCLDADESVLVVAPTSAGKTFISFYAMEKVLRESDDGILVYVAPTKALVNQVAAEIYARFRKDLGSGSCWAIHTRDYRINDPQRCQILVTVPEMFAIMLLSPPLAHVWTPRIKRIILDEIHTIGQLEGGAVWEQILLLAPCPIIGLSATIGQPEIFNSWLASVQQAHGFKHRFISYPHRYSHLRKFVYILPETPPEFPGLSARAPQSTYRLRFLHPVATLSFGNPSLPPDFSLEARDTLSLYEAFKKLEDQLPFDLSSIDPINFFAGCGFLKQMDVLRFEARLKDCLNTLITIPNSADSDSLLQRVVAKVNDPVLSGIPSEKLNSLPSGPGFLDGLIGLLSDLHADDKLPALLFSFDRSLCELMAKCIIKKLIDAEQEWRKGREWLKKLQQWEAWKDRQESQRRSEAKTKLKRATIEDAQDRQELTSTWESSFDPSDPSPQFSFANTRKYSKAELQEDIADLRWTSTPGWVYTGLRRGIGVHHAGMNKQYRSLIESLFRLGYLRVLICTGTLALGINAPTKTSVFCGDSPYLTALMYRQCAGRAGRRGYDLLGNVIFYGLPMDRIQRLILSRLPSLTGNFPLTSTLCLRLLNLLHNSESPDLKRQITRKVNDSGSEFAIKCLHDILNLPQISFGSTTGREQLLHHLRFSIDYLRRSGLLGANGEPTGLYAIAAHLYHTEPSNFALIALMRGGILHKICKKNDEDAKRELMLHLCYLFGRRYLPEPSVSPESIKDVRSRYPSLVVLPPLPAHTRQVLVKHNEGILRVFSAYAGLYARQYAESLGKDDVLPLSGTPVGGASASARELSVFEKFLNSNKLEIHTRSLFVANSGHTDQVKTVEEMAQTARRGLQLNEHAIPSLSSIIASMSNAPDNRKLNAYLYDYYVHEQVDTLVHANGIRRGDVWYALEDFNLTLLTVRTALQQLLRSSSLDSNTVLQEDDVVSVDNSWDGDEITVVESWDSATVREIGSDAESAPRAQTNPAVNSAEIGFPRPPGVTDSDWRVYQLLNALTNEFGDKFKKMWA